MVKRKTNLTRLEKRPVFVTDVPKVEVVIQPLAQRSMFWRPAYLNQSAWIEHIPFAFWLIQAHHPRTLVELGSYSGVSYFAFCQAVERLGLDTRCFAIDTWKGDEHAGFYDETVFEKVKAYNDRHYSAFSRLVRSTFDEALNYFEDCSIDLLHIDGLHTLEAVQHDFNSWLPKLSKRGIAVLHDTNVRERNFGVYRFFGNLKRRYPHFEFVHGHGLGVVSVGNQYSELMGHLFGASKDESARQSIHEVFSRLGRACADTLDAKIYKDKTTALNRTVADQKSKFDDLTHELAQTKQRLRTCEHDFTNSKTSLQQHIQRFATERGHLLERVTLLEELRGELKSEIAALKTRVDHAATKLSERTIASTQNEAHNQELQRQVAEINGTLAFYKDALSATRADLEKNNQALSRTSACLAQRDLEIGRITIELECERNVLSDRNQQLTDLQSRLNDLQNESSVQLDQRNAIILRLEAALKTLRGEYEELSTRLHARLEELGVLASRLDERERQLTDMSQGSENLTNRIAAAQEAQRAQDSEIARLKSQITSLQDASRIDLTEKAAKISKLEADKKTLLSEKQALAKRIEDRFKEIAILTNMLEERNTAWGYVAASLRSVGAPFFAARKRLDTETKKNVSLVRKSGLFDDKWYLESYPDVASHGWDPVEHYLKHGAFEGRCPGPHFDTRWYLKTYPDVHRDGINPLIHFIKFGRRENRRPKP